MRRLPLAAFLALALAACDAASPSDPDALIGRWTATGVTTSQWVVSRIDQPVPNFSGPVDGAVTAAGAVNLTLPYVSSAGRPSARFTVQSSASAPVRNPSLLLRMGGSSSEARLDLDIDLPSQRGDRYRTTFPGGTSLFTYEGGRLTVPEIELVEETGTGGTVRVSGTLEVPVVQLRAGTEALTRTSAHPPESVHSLVFRSDGTVDRESGHRTESGHWEAWDTGEGSMTIDGFTYRFRFAAEDGVLRLTYDYETEAAALDGVEDGLFAEPGSFESARTQSVRAYRIGR